MSFGFVVFLSLLLFSVQVIYHLHATSILSGAAVDAARSVAGYDESGDRIAAQSRAEATMRDRLGQYGRERVTLTWSGAGSDIDLRVQASHPSVFPTWFSSRLPFTSIDRTISIQAETVQ